MSLLLEHDFRDLSNGDPISPSIGCGILREDAGAYSVLEEQDPTVYFFAQRQPADNFAKVLFNLTTFVLSIGGQIDHHGLICSPGSLEGTNADLSAQYIDPTEFFGTALDEFLFQIAVGFRGKKTISEWVGGMVESKWDSVNLWDKKLEISAVRADSNGITKFATRELEVPYLEINELTVRVKNTSIVVGHNGTYTLEADNTFDGGNQTVLWIKAITKSGAVTTPFAVLLEFVGRSLLSGRKKPIKEIPGNSFLPPITAEHFYPIPIQTLEQAGSIKQIAPTMWQFTRETLVELEDGTIVMKCNEGAVVVSHQHLLNQAEYHWCKVRYL